MSTWVPAGATEDFLIAHTATLLHCYRHWIANDLIPSQGSPLQQAEALFKAPFIVVSSNREADPILTYGNEAALKLWEMTWGDFIQTPARTTAEPMHQEERQKFLNRVKSRGFIDNYEGIRISSTGKRFKIQQATVWNLLDERGNATGQAATFSQWGYL